MQLISARVQNFKLLEDVRLAFSTQRSRPLTVIRAENASGKTSLLYAFQWAFHGVPGLPASASERRLTSTSTPYGKATTVSVMIEFEISDHLGNAARYRLVRSVIETPTSEDAFERQRERVRLLRITAAGEEEVADPEGMINALVPERLHDVFFTNGDDVQTFISGQIGASQRQGRVHDAIRSLLGIDRFRTAADDIADAFQKLRREVSQSGGSDTSALAAQLEETTAEVAVLAADLEKLRDRQTRRTDQKAEWEKELRSLTGIGELEELNARIEQAEKEHVGFERQRYAALGRMRDALESEGYSWHFMDGQLRHGLAVLEDLADRHIIPARSLGVLTDRLDLERCICGESLAPGTRHREHVETLLQQQESVSESHQRLTELSHVAGRAHAEEESRRESGRAFVGAAIQSREEFTEATDHLRAKALELERLKAQRSSIDEEHVRRLTNRIAGVETQRMEAEQEIWAKAQDLEHSKERQGVQEKQLSAAEAKAVINSELALKRDVAQELSTVAMDVLKVLEGEYVRRVSERMSDLFMRIIGAPDDPMRADFEASLYAGVHIDNEFNIVIDTNDGRHLDPDFELNGASQRALTLSFIWALMEVSGAEAPRMIDTPLGMVSGGVKRRMVEAIAAAPVGSLPSFQVVLFMTRSELRDVEDLIDERAGVGMTLSFSGHYPIDLVNSWGTDRPVSRICSCNHRQSCRVCARHYDDQQDVTFRDIEG